MPAPSTQHRRGHVDNARALPTFPTAPWPPDWDMGKQADAPIGALGCAVNTADLSVVPFDISDGVCAENGF
jgi:hypothetical protein